MARLAPVLYPAVLLTALAVLAERFTHSTTALRVLDNFHWTLSYAAGATMAWMGVRHAPRARRAPLAWFATGMTGYAVGQVAWDLQVLSGWNPFPAPSDAFYLLQGLCCAIGLGVQLRALAPRGRLGVAALDAGSASVAALALVLSLYLPLRGNNSVLQMTVLAAYPLGLLAAACIGTMMLPALRLRPNAGWLLFVGGLAANGALWMRWNELTLSDSLSDGTLFNASFSVLALVMGAGIARWRPEPVDDARWESRYDGLLRLLPMGVVVGASAAVVLAFTLPGIPPAVQSPVAYGAGVVAILAFARQSVMVFERERMLEAVGMFRVLFDSAHDAILVTDENGITDCNPAAARLFGRSRREMLRRSPRELSPERQPDGRLSREAGPPYRAAALAGTPQSFPWRHQRADGSEFAAEVTLHRVDLATGPVLQAIVRDVTERIEAESTRQRLEEQLRHASRMEAVGRLAGGVAHDFNNILTVILGTTELALHRVPEGDRRRRDLEEIRRSAQRAAGLTSQLLSFSRKQVVAPVPCDLSELVRGALDMLRRLIGEDVELVFEPGPGLATIHVDRTQLEQVLVNLAVNARDAMPDGGRLVITTANVSVEASSEGARPDARPGEYVRLEVRDEGMGIPADVIEHVFEPFFTTKEVGRGTGLGLSTVYGIVRQGGGFIDVASSPGAGTCFALYFPSSRESAVAAPAQDPRAHPRGTERVLLVEDDAVVRDLTLRMLQGLGYDVRTAANGAEAVELASDAGFAVDLLVTDLVMPGMNGRQLHERLCGGRPGLRVLFISGYTANILSPLGVPETGGRLLQKPFTLGALASAVRETLDRALAA